MFDYGIRYHKILITKLAALIADDPEDTEYFKSLNGKELEWEYYVVFGTHKLPQRDKGI